MSEYPPNKKGFLLKGFIVELKEGGLIGFTPSFHVFQYNPQILTTTVGVSAVGGDAITEAKLKAAAKADKAAPQPVAFADGMAMASQPDDPTLSFSLEVVVDAMDDLNEGHWIGTSVGIADRLAGIELLTYPQNTLLQDALAEVGGAIGDALGFRSTVDTPLMNIQLFVFGPGKVLPIRITSMVIEEQAFHPNLLYPIRAKVSLGMQVLRPSDLKMYPDTSVVRQIANGCYIFTREQKSAFAIIGSTARTVEGVLDLAGDIF